MRSAARQASVSAPFPKWWAKTISRANPKIRLTRMPAATLEAAKGPYQPVDKIATAFERRCIRAGRLASAVHTVKHALHYVMSAIHSVTPRLRFALLLGRIALLFPLRRALPARQST